METEPKMDIVKEADQSEKNKNVQVNHDMQKIGKKPVALKREALGFIGNRLQLALLRELPDCRSFPE